MNAVCMFMLMMVSIGGIRLNPIEELIPSFEGLGQKSAWHLLVLTHTRPAMLQRCLKTLLSLSGIENFDISVSIDSKEKLGEVEEILTHLENENPWLKNRLRVILKAPSHFRDSAQALSDHVMFGLDELYSGSAQYGVFVEEDLVPSKDFIEYLQIAAGIIDKDKSLFCASAWNDNAFEPFAGDNLKFLRTNGFPGYGWLTTRRTANLVRGKMPYGAVNWDGWLADEVKQMQMECIVPEVPRIRHLGGGGTHITDNSAYERMSFSEIQPDSSHLSSAMSRLTRKEFDLDLMNRIKNAKKVDIDEVADPSKFSFYDDTEYLVVMGFISECRKMFKYYKLFDSSCYKMSHDGVLQIDIPKSRSGILFVDSRIGGKWLS